MNIADLGLHGIGNIGGSKAVIKSVQSGIAEGKMNAGYTVAISAIDLSRAIVLISVSTQAATAFSVPYVSGITSTSITFKNSDATYSAKVSWQVIEFENVKSIQTGEAVMAASTNNISVTVSDINVAKSFLVFNSLSANNPQTPIGSIASSTSISFVRYQHTQSNTIYWQLIEFN